MAMVGYNAEAIAALDVTIDQTIGEVWNIWNKTWENLETGIAEFLFTPKGKTQTGPEMHKKMVESAQHMSNDVKLFIETINNIEKTWASAVGYSVSSKKGSKKVKTTTGEVSLIDGTFPTGNIDYKDLLLDRDAQGNQGVDEEIGQDFLGKLATYKEDLANQIKGYERVLQADAAFLGGGQAEAIEDLFARMINNFAEYFTTTQDFISKTISDTLQEYGSVARDSVQKFSSVTFPASSKK